MTQLVICCFKVSDVLGASSSIQPKQLEMFQMSADECHPTGGRCHHDSKLMKLDPGRNRSFSISKNIPEPAGGDELVDSLSVEIMRKHHH